MSFCNYRTEARIIAIVVVVVVVGIQIPEFSGHAGWGFWDLGSRIYVCRLFCKEIIILLSRLCLGMLHIGVRGSLLRLRAVRYCTSPHSPLTKIPSLPCSNFRDRSLRLPRSHLAAWTKDRNVDPKGRRPHTQGVECAMLPSRDSCEGWLGRWVIVTCPADVASFVNRDLTSPVQTRHASLHAAISCWNVFGLIWPW